MSISSVSLTFISMISTPAAGTPVAGVAAAPNDGSVAKNRSCEGHEPRRRNVLYDAMMSALRELGLTQTPAQPASPDAAATASSSSASAPAAAATANPTAAAVVGPNAASTATDTAASGTLKTDTASGIEDAVLSFAHALWQALRGDEHGSRRGRGQRDDDSDDDRHCHHRHHHRHDQRADGVYDNYSGLAARIEALALRVETPAAPAAAAKAASPDAASDMAMPKLPGLDPVPNGAPVAAADPDTAAAPVAAVPAAPASNSLAEAFSAMLKVLRGGDGAAPAGTTESSLASFLHSLARGLDADRSAPTMSAVGVMINISA